MTARFKEGYLHALRMLQDHWIPQRVAAAARHTCCNCTSPRVRQRATFLGRYTTYDQASGWKMVIVTPFCASCAYHDKRRLLARIAQRLREQIYVV